MRQKPQFDLGGSLEASYGNYDAIIVKGYVTGPISDTVAFSIGGNYNRRDGYARDLHLGQDVNDRNRWGVRGQLLFEPSDALSIRSEEHTSELQSIMRLSYAVFCFKKQKT